MGTHSKNDNVVAEGEVTGHAHRANGNDVVVDDSKSIHAPSGAEITHEEHGAIQIPAGVYDTGIVQEMDHVEEQVRQVAD